MTRYARLPPFHQCNAWCVDGRHAIRLDHWVPLLSPTAKDLGVDLGAWRDWDVVEVRYTPEAGGLKARYDDLTDAHKAAIEEILKNNFDEGRIGGRIEDYAHSYIVVLSPLDPDAIIVRGDVQIAVRGTALPPRSA